MAALYLMLGLGSLVASPKNNILPKLLKWRFILSKIGPKVCISLSSITNFIWILTCLLPVFKEEQKHIQTDSSKGESMYFNDTFICTLTMLTSMAVGFCEALEWVAQGYYISSCATTETKGFFFGYFWAYYQGSQIFSSLLTGFIFQTYGLITFYLVMALFCLMATSTFLLLRQPKKLKNSVEGTLSQAHWFDQMKITLRLTVSKKMLYLVPQLIWSGLSLSVITGVLVPLVSSSVLGALDINEKLMKAMYSMTCLGVGEVLGSLSIGQVIDRKGNKPTSIIALILIAL
jgi:MFS family permease